MTQNDIKELERAANIVLAAKVGSVLESVIEEIDQSGDIPRHFLLNVSGLNFIERFVFTQLDILKATKEETIMALVLLDRILYEQTREEKVAPTRLNFMVALLLAMKTNREEPVSNLAAVFSSKYSLRQINRAEKSCLALLDYKLFVSQEEFVKYNNTFGN